MSPDHPMNLEKNSMHILKFISKYIVLSIVMPVTIVAALHFYFYHFG
ncbi:UNVERIFIED_CONTAM: hypothetical protein MKS84_20450 [Pseudomonas sp. JL1]